MGFVVRDARSTPLVLVASFFCFEKWAELGERAGSYVRRG